MYLNPVSRKENSVVEEIKQVLQMEDREVINTLIEENYATPYLQKYLRERGVHISSRAIATYRFLYLKAKEEQIPLEELLTQEFSPVLQSTALGASLLEEMADLWSDIDALNRIIKEGTDLVIATQGIEAKDVINAINVKSHILARNNDRLVQYVAELTRTIERILDILREVLPSEYLEIVQRRFEEEFGG